MTKQQIILGMAIASLAIASCKKKVDTVLPDTESPSSDQNEYQLYRPSQVYQSYDGINYELSYRFKYDGEGRVQEKIWYYPSIDNASKSISHIVHYFSYLPGLLYAKKTFYSKVRLQYFSAGYDSTYLLAESLPA